MTLTLPLDLRAEALLMHYPRTGRRIELKGAHKRNAYEDIGSIQTDGNGQTVISLARNGLYDILPESLFHPIDRFDNIPANNYQERFKEECEQQQLEEENARRFFRPFDNFLIELSAFVASIKESGMCGSDLEDIICDGFTEEYKTNRFVGKARKFMPMCRHIRGNHTLLTLMLRNILSDEKICLSERNVVQSLEDRDPRYGYRLAESGEESGEEGGNVYLGNGFDESVTVFYIRYWNDAACREAFPEFLAEMEVFGRFLNDYFVGLEAGLRFDISTYALPVRLSDDVFFNYLDYNTNL